MTEVRKFLVAPYRTAKKGRLVAGEVRDAGTAENAVRMADNLASNYTGVAAYQMVIDDETGEVTDAKILARHGQVINILEGHV
ncbi:hypothetical protein N5C66_06010 [Rhizobium pusense]|uniref:hypothetical protein n=1 Tax=Agrobacterium pusense TaxID=648995 RepID=UPI002448D4A1|nr:hypothetical protein [Agrobacterium pusense]MDH1097452.1 hypothetical protein [Agrobacterium pusense]MDH1111282.1 hypothetical protein [Agrobacterium pusense]MDH2193485.1 hypothetical protein [Agrobacterium pusense]